MITGGLHNEYDLIRLTSLGDEKAFRIIFNFYSSKLNNYILRITDNEEIAEEIVMDTFVKIWTNRSKLCDIANLDGYVYTLARNQAFNAIKRRAHETQILQELKSTKSELSDATEDTIIYNDYKHLLDNTLAKLPPQQRLVYTLSRDEGLKYDEIAMELKLSKNTVKAHLKKAVSTVRTVFSNYLMATVLVLVEFTK